MGLADYDDFVWIGGKIAVFRSSLTNPPPQNRRNEPYVRALASVTRVGLPSLTFVDLMRISVDEKRLSISMQVPGLTLRHHRQAPRRVRHKHQVYKRRLYRRMPQPAGQIIDRNAVHQQVSCVAVEQRVSPTLFPGAIAPSSSASLTATAVPMRY